MPASTNLDDLANEVKVLDNKLLLLKGTLAGWQRSGNSYPDFDYFVTNWGEFVYPPFDSAGFERASTLSLGSGAWTTVVFDNAIWNTGIVDYSTAVGLFRFLKPSNGKVFLIQGRCEYNENSSCNFRAVEVTSYPSTVDVVMSQINKGAIIQTFSYLYRPPDGSSAFSIQVFREAIATFVLSFASFSIWEVGRV